MDSVQLYQGCRPKIFLLSPTPTENSRNYEKSVPLKRADQPL